MNNSPERSPRENNQDEIERLKQHLDSPVEIKNTPAAKILSSQVEKNVDDIKQKVTGVQPQMMAHSLAVRFLQTGMYARISEQAMFGPKDYERFDNPERIKPKVQEVQQSLAKSFRNITQKQPNAQLIEDNGWVHFIKGKPEETKYRIYLSPEPEQTGTIFENIVDIAPEDLAYKMKTLSHWSKEVELGRMDKIVIYCSEDNFAKVLEVVKQMVARNQEAFTNRLPPGGGIFSPFPGVSIAKQPEKKDGQEVTGTQAIAERIDENLEKNTQDIVRHTFQKYKTPYEASQSDEGRFYWSALTQTNQRALTFHLGNEKVTNEQNTELTNIFNRVLFGFAVKALVENSAIDHANFKKEFIEQIRRSTTSLSTSQFDALSKAEPIDSVLINMSIQIILERTRKIAGLAIGFNNGMKKGIEPAEMVPNLIS